MIGRRLPLVVPWLLVATAAAAGTVLTSSGLDALLAALGVRLGVPS